MSPPPPAATLLHLVPPPPVGVQLLNVQELESTATHLSPVELPLIRANFLMHPQHGLLMATRWDIHARCQEVTAFFETPPRSVARTSIYTIDQITPKLIEDYLLWGFVIRLPEAYIRITPLDATVEQLWEMIQAISPYA
jgi:hypothetical protein